MAILMLEFVVLAIMRLSAAAYPFSFSCDRIVPPIIDFSSTAICLYIKDTSSPKIDMLLVEAALDATIAVPSR